MDAVILSEQYKQLMILIGDAVSLLLQEHADETRSRPVDGNALAELHADKEADNLRGKSRQIDHLLEILRPANARETRRITFEVDVETVRGVTAKSILVGRLLIDALFGELSGDDQKALSSYGVSIVAEKAEWMP